MRKALLFLTILFFSGFFYQSQAQIYGGSWWPSIYGYRAGIVSSPYSTYPFYWGNWLSPIYGAGIVSSPYSTYRSYYPGYYSSYRYSSPFYYQYPSYQQEGYVVKIVESKEKKAKKVLIDLGSDKGIGKGNFLEVFREEETFEHPVTKKKIPGPEWRVGELQIIESAGPLYSLAEVVKGKVDVGDIVKITKPISGSTTPYY